GRYANRPNGACRYAALAVRRRPFGPVSSPRSMLARDITARRGPVRTRGTRPAPPAGRNEVRTLVRWKENTRQRLSVVGAVVAIAMAGVTTPAAAEPGTNPDGPGDQSLQAQLDTAARAYNDAKGRLDASHARQADLQQRLDAAVQRLGQLDGE